MSFAIYQVDAFASRIFGGNPAAVCPLDSWLPDELMQRLAEENNLPETVFFVKNSDKTYHIRWFTPTIEVRLCGHATLATAHVLYTQLGYDAPSITFDSLSGPLTCRKGEEENCYILNFPSQPAVPAELPEGMLKAFGNIKPIATLKSVDDWLVVMEDEDYLRKMQPDFNQLATMPGRGVIVTAASQQKEIDFVSRCFYAQSGINEDPATGSAHTVLTPFWAAQLQKNTLNAIQASSRVGELKCTLLPSERVEIEGKCTTYLQGNFFLP